MEESNFNQNFEELVTTLRAEEQGQQIRRGAAAAQLGNLGDKRAVEPLLAVLQNDAEDWYVRMFAAASLGDLKDDKALATLLAAFTDDISTVRAAVALALGKLGDKGAIPSLIAALHDEDESVRCRAAEALGLLGAVEALAALIDVRKTDEGVAIDGEKVSLTAAKAIRRIKRKQPVTTEVVKQADG